MEAALAKLGVLSAATAALVALLGPRAAIAWELRSVVSAEGHLDASQKLTPCPVDSGLYFCGTEEGDPRVEMADQIDTGQLVNPPIPSTTNVQVPAGTTGGPFGAGATVVASPGSLRATLGAGAAGNWYRLSWLNEEQLEEHLDLFQQAAAASAANVALDDPITIQGTPGTVGTFQLSIRFERVLGVTGQGGAAATGQAYVYDPTGVGGVLANIGITDCTSCNNPQQTATATFEAAAGSTWTLGQQINNMNASATTNESHPTSSASADVGNTMHTSLAILTPGFSIASDSGHDYVSAPEPATAASMLTAWGVLAARARRRAASRPAGDSRRRAPTADEPRR